MSIEDPIQAWWRAFQAKTEDLNALFARQAEWDLPAWMSESLNTIHADLMWEFGRAMQGEGHRLVITPESRRYLRPLVHAILRQAPEIEGWEFYGYRLPEDYGMAVMTVDARTGGDIDQTVVRAEVDELNRIGLIFAGPQYADDEERAFQDVVVATETLLGEETLDRWIGCVDIESLDSAGDASWKPIRDLPSLVSSLQQQVYRGLPDAPYWQICDQAEWSLFELKPEEDEDYPAQCDMFVGGTMLPSMWRNAHSTQAFDSVRFSKHDEVFCYIKIDGSEGWDETKFADRSEVEDAVDSALREAEVGCVVGGGTGLQYSYIDLALDDVSKSAALIKSALRAGNLPRRTWLQFFDTDLEARWISIWDDASPPPMWDFED